MTNILDAASRQLLEEQRGVPGAPAEQHNHDDDRARKASGKRDGRAKSTGAAKRKAEDEADGHLDKKVFTLRPDPPSMYHRPSTWRPLQLLDRARLPLCYLDTAAADSKIAQQRFFACDTELLGPAGGEGTPRLLIARLESDMSLYAVERVDTGTYAVCRLAHWVKARHLQGEDAGKLPGPVPLQRVSGNKSRGKQERAGKSREGGSGGDKLATQQLCAVSDADTGVPISPVPPAPQPWQADEHDLAALDELAAEAEHMAPAPTQRQLFEKLVCQYMETLYLSKTSLAFFAKGPLSRSRAACSETSGKMTVAELARFLRSLCVQQGAMEKKYREKLPEVLDDIVRGAMSDEETFTKTPVRKKAPRRLHPTKAGMFPLEEDYAQRWWLADDDGAGRKRPGETAEAWLRRRLNDIRLRETLIQVIVLLETLALEASPDYKPLDEPDSPADMEETQEDHDPVPQAKPKPARPKKVQDLSLALDVLVDKLCIWQSIEEDGASTHTPKREAGQSKAAPSSANATNSDLLRDFFSEVIRPFYMSRLPKLVAALGKKLGGPTASPPKQAAVKPGAAVIRRAPRAGEPTGPVKQPRKSLHRIATDTMAAQKHARAPSLVRFSSDSATLASVKRERSTTPALSSIPLASPTSATHSRRGSIADFKRLNRRQIDLTALSAATDARQKKKAAIDEQVRNAISTLRKPNRAAAVRDVVDFADGRRAVLVDATPKRINKFAAITPQHAAKPTATALDTVGRGAAAVPATDSRPRYLDAVPSSSVKGAAPLRPIDTSPSRGAAWAGPFKDVPVDGRPHDLSISGRCTITPAVLATPSKPRPRVQLDPGHGGGGNGVFATPVKKGGGGNGLAQRVSATPRHAAAAPAAGSAAGSASIYTALGWDDEVDDLA